MKFFAFDSFEGLPEIKGIDKESSWKKGQYAYTKEEVLKRLKRVNIDLERVHLIKGWFKDTLNRRTKKELKCEKASIIFIDSDLYESAKPVMKFITSLIQEGTVIVLDDWSAFKLREDRGIQKAFYEWKERNNNLDIVPFYQSYNRVAFVVKRINPIH